MKAYGDYNGNSGIIGYEIGYDEFDGDYMAIQYASGGVYHYLERNVGVANFREMKRRAEMGSGLNSFINNEVRKSRTHYRPAAPMARVAKQTVDVRLDTADAVGFISELAKRYNVRVTVNG